MATNNNENSPKEYVQLEISLDKLKILFESGLICAAEIGCLNSVSKQHISDLCLRACAKKIACNIALFNEYSTTQALHFKPDLKKKIEK